MVDGHEEQDRIDRLVAEGARDWRVPPAPPLDAMWERIEAAHFDRRGAAGRPATRWWALAGAGMAAALVLGVGVGRWSARGERQAVANRAAAPAPAMVVAMPPDESGPFALATTDYLDETAALLAALPAESPDAQGRRLAGQAAELLTTTRLLLDSPAAAPATPTPSRFTTASRRGSRTIRWRWRRACRW